MGTSDKRQNPAQRAGKIAREAKSIGLLQRFAVLGDVEALDLVFP